MKLHNLGIFVLAFWALTAAVSGNAAAQDKVSVGVFPVSSSLPYFVALERGFFKEQNIEPEMTKLMGGPPNVGEFRDGVGTFYAQDSFNGRVILIKYEWSKITPNSAHFEQSFSDDGGKTWEVNWITDQNRVASSSTQ